MAELKAILVKTLEGYAGKALNGYSYLTHNDAETVFTVVGIGIVKSRKIINTSLLVRLEGEEIIIEEDLNTKPLVDALIQAGVPQHQIRLAYLEPAQKVTD